MKIAVTGAAGYIGSVLVGELVKAGHTVMALDDLSSGSDSLVRYGSAIVFVRGDAADERALRQVIGTADVIIPLAAVVGMAACDRAPVRATATNLDAIRLLMKMRSRHQRVVFPNTNSGYGSRGEARATVCTEETPLEPVSLYGKLKVEAEAVVLDHENVVSLRLATVFGISPRMRKDLLVNDFVWRALKDRRIEVYEGHAMRNYVHVADVAAALHWVAYQPTGSPSADVFNFGNDSINLSKKDLALKIGQFVEIAVADGSGKDPDRRDYVVSSAKLKRRGFEARRSLDFGIAELIEGYKRMPEFYSP